MAQSYRKEKHRTSNIIYALIVSFLICAVFLSMVASFYYKAEKEAYEKLHLQTKQIKDDLILQINSDRENLATMANFAAKTYASGENYQVMFESFKPIGLFASIGILNPDNTYITKDGVTDLTGKLNFEDALKNCNNVTSRIKSLTIENKEVVRSSVPIVLDGETIGILYGVITIDNLRAKYNKMAEELDAQLFVYGKDDGKFVIDTINNPPRELSQLKTRKYNKGYSYDKIISTENGFTSFKSISTNEDLYVHYSTIEDFNWGIMLARYTSQVFAETHNIAKILSLSFSAIVLLIGAYLIYVLYGEKRKSKITSHASNIRHLLLEINQQNENMHEALQNIQEVSQSRSAFFIDTDGEDYHYISETNKNLLLKGEDRIYFTSELFRYTSTLSDSKKSNVEMMHIIPNAHLEKTNQKLYNFFNEKGIKSALFAIITSKNNHISIIGVINPGKTNVATTILKDTSVCFSIAIYNKKHLNKTELAATTDALTGTLNRASYTKDVLKYNEAKPMDFACIYIDVNELHIRNNKYGHAAGDAMLVYITNTLKDVFFGHKIYRIGGDEFLIFTQNITTEDINRNLKTFNKQLKLKGYNVAIGISYRKQNTNCEEMVREAEVRMYEAKAQYYQNKEKNLEKIISEDNYVRTKTGIREIDAILSVLKEHYNGIYRVSLDTDHAHRILMPTYLGYSENERHFSKLFEKYINEMVHPDFHRSVMSFLNYDAIKRQISRGEIPRITYQKTNGETVILTVYNLDENSENGAKIDDTLWVYAKD